MSRIVDQLAAVGETIEEAVQQAVEGGDVALQLRAIKSQLLTEKVIADDRWETINSKLDRVIELFGTNGSGGHG